MTVSQSLGPSLLNMFSPPVTPHRASRPHTANPSATHTRDHSRSQSSAHPMPVTPHQQILRARLERVLHSAAVADEKNLKVSPRRASPAPAPRRYRSKTESNIPPSSSPSLFFHPPKRPSTPHTHHLSPPSPCKKSTSALPSPRSASRSASASLTSITPPLVPDDEDLHLHEPKSVLLTPPSTPSPHAFGLFRVSDWGYKIRCYDSNTPPEDDEEDDEDDDESCSSFYSSYKEGSSISSSAIHSSLPPPVSPSPKSRAFHPLSPASPHTSPTRPFNARRASAQCRAMEGYVSFANVEGLGAPADDDLHSSPVEVDNRGGRGSGLMSLAWGGGMMKKILGGGEKLVET